ncbi:SMP-30/gluconolactonase/LRE family protein [Salinicola sp. JS01]|uniref:SMP-30/gluconolactonase/LRE family protein n=1 Tax=Salinicola sp. JS01 TaxID=3050071 RepID=UPI00255B962D|nr:SMP-30/gluconolactonase/LRE family protein [Salinicola sp. JS01]WIX33140.1 SMP-30/gluconolactonase/LRE family protein [Salinicola sp. JS01]
MSRDATALWEVNAQLGEGPVWSPAHGALLFVDILGARLHAWRPADDTRRSWTLDEACCWLLPRDTGGFVAGLRSGVVELDFDLEQGPRPGKRLTPIEWLPEGDRLNDAKSDGHGRLWFGSMDNAEVHAGGYLYRLDGRGVVEMDRDYHITNGPAISPDGATLYHNDSARQTVFAFDLSDSGELSRKREHIRLAPGSGYPDGMTCDREGGLWLALWDGRRVARYHPDGSLDREVALPVSRPTSCAFGGEAFDRLFVTSAAVGCADEPLAGALFEIPVEIGGSTPTPLSLPI